MILILDNNNNRAIGLNASLGFIGEAVQLLSEDCFEQECKKYLSACREAYHNIGRVVQLQLEETEDLSNSVSNIGWG